ncbi:hypothetical protein ABT167_01310 [Streptomyces sp. NPDC001792]|uniref:hypothetical protein n=1 Tax=Streptomyces sp. NPDC001792 TaxID=3154524 RepID=UPI0033249B83
MALPRKGARHIVVDGTTYRWRLRRRPTYAQSMAWTPGTFAVEHADSPVRPGDVADAVRRALREGWNPTSPGSSFRLDGGGG